MQPVMFSRTSCSRPRPRTYRKSKVVQPCNVDLPPTLLQQNIILQHRRRLFGPQGRKVYYNPVCFGPVFTNPPLSTSRMAKNSVLYFPVLHFPVPDFWTSIFSQPVVAATVLMTIIVNNSTWRQYSGNVL